MTDRTPKATKLRADLMHSLPAAARTAVETLIAAARTRTVFAVGGAVRDLLLERSVKDVDLVTEGDAISLARAAWPDAKLKEHARFGTGSATFGDVRIDVSMARRETYPRAGALPKVAPASIRDDLARRDFSINAIALRLNGRAELLDPGGGVDDVRACLVRVLHDRSFIDDPTRIFRALRYEARLGFTVEPHTRRLLSEALPCVRAVSPERVRRELELILSDAAGAGLELCQSTGALQAVHPALHWSAAKSRALTSEASVHVPRLLFGFALMAAGVSAEDASAIGARLRLRRDESAAVAGIASMTHTTELLRRPDARPSGVVMLLDRYPLPSVAAYAMTTGNTIARQLALRYLEEWRHVRPLLSGRDLESMGVPAGPQLQRGLQLIRAARLDGWAGDRGDEKALARRFVKSIRDSSAMTSTIDFEAS